MMTTLEGVPVPVAVTGPEKGVAIVLLGAEQRPLAAYDAVCDRLHNAGLRTVVIGFEPRLTPKSVLGILDTLGISWAVLVGDRGGAELAWQLAAKKLGRFIGLVVIDRGHPAVADAAGVVADDQCPPVEIGTTILVSSAATRKVANNSQRVVYADHRVVDLSAQRNAHDSTAQLATEIVLRTSGW
ncbi:alpha/beta hydrolase [Mycobacterium bourgelatii]|uniref:Alpha/beta hydrolase n=1 Tax=Mycobacterium bourgelatii TaxID=1273442 RepID=A0A7I9YM12_MYCBU|nr:alpha/beta hydrolase [Mycobacterium bourgelatii]MCV6977794.1 alpha/beta hydrolase [Mycobacterium bourgelatii]GFG89726.1 alpha/beta hydrolase [Mycobacterium bourgelatii]